jgi:hypothetical protein
VAHGAGAVFSAIAVRSLISVSETYDRYISPHRHPDRCPNWGHPLIPLVRGVVDGLELELSRCNRCDEVYHRVGQTVTSVQSKPARLLAREILRLRAQFGS